MKFLASFWLLIFLSLNQFAQADSRKIVIIETMPVPVVINHSDAIQDSFILLEKQGDISFQIEILKAEGSKENAKNLLQTSLGKRRPDLVIAIATLAAQASKEVLLGTGIPLLFCVVADPVGSRIVDAVGLPSGNNISGILYTQLRETKLEMVLRILRPNYKDQRLRFGIIHSDYPSVLGELRELRKKASLVDNIEFIPYLFPYKPVPAGLPEMYQDLKTGLEKLRGQVDFLWEVPGPLSELEEYSKILVNSGTPVVLANTKLAVERGALMAVPTNYKESGQQIVEMADKIFHGTEVGSLPVSIPRKFDLYINMTTAEKMDLRIPSHILMIAGKNIIH